MEGQGFLTQRSCMARTTFYGRKNIQVTFQPNIGLDVTARQSVVEILNLLLADEAVLSLKTHSADGHAGGISGPDLQSLYDAQYKEINDIVIEISERVRILGGSHLSSSEELINFARLDGKLAVVPGVMHILADHEAFIRFLREDAQKCSEIYEDQGTFALLVNVLRLHEKMAWMLRSYIENVPAHTADKDEILNDA
jgi:starvation-inducible DNA-binding protein